LKLPYAFSRACQYKQPEPPQEEVEKVEEELTKKKKIGVVHNSTGKGRWTRRICQRIANRQTDRQTDRDRDKT
jgi:hypothetical protein